MSDYDVTPAELQTLARFAREAEPETIDPHHLAKLLSLALLVQREGGTAVTASGRDLLARVGTGQSVHVEGAGRL